MKKTLIAIAGAFFLGISSLCAASTDYKTVNGPEKVMVNVLSRDYEYPIEVIQAAVLERLEREGLKGKKAKNGFFSFMGVKYNYLWDNNFDLYLGFSGNKSAGSVMVLMTTGYNNYVDLHNPQTRQRIVTWLDELDLDIQAYLHNKKIENAEKAYEKTRKELDKLNKEQRSLEAKARKNSDNLNKAKAQQTIAKGPNAVSVDPKQVAKEEKAIKKLENEKVKLEKAQADNQKEMLKAKETLTDQEKEIYELKANRPK
ncbi:MAG: hypothetical protein J6Y77_07860 [Paludibacteraceae bacterium]|nr:hypothetical protein [Paludibacteraceae bacterium]